MHAPPDDRLESWKEIAAYLNRSVRTVRRWEHHEGLPVHRHLHLSLATVYAHKTELDAWRRDPNRAAEPVPAPRVKSIAVLPFANLSVDADNAFFADGLTDEVTANLSRVRTLRVISRTSASTFRGQRNVKDVAAALGVRYLLEGSVRRSGNRVRITAQLIDATADQHLWGDTWDGTMEDVFAIQERLARLIVASLELRLSSGEDRHLAARPIEDVRAWECYVRARQEGWRWHREAIDHAVQLLRNGLELIGDNARLYAALGLAWLQYREAGIDFSERPLAEAEACARRVTAEEGRLLRGWIHYSRGRVDDAVGDLRAALELDPNNADALLLLSNCFLISGRVASARPLIRSLLEVDPLTPLTRCMPAWADIVEGRFASALEPYRQMFTMDTANPMARLFYLWVLLLNGRDAEAAELERSYAQEARNTVPAKLAAFLVHGTVPSDLEALVTGPDFFARFLAEAFARWSRPDQALRWLEVAMERGFVDDTFLRHHDPFLASLRGDPRFEALLARMAGRRTQSSRAAQGLRAGPAA
jgi:TolB-like protein/tetratricopeptide (TPR) repeat protein